MTTASPAIAPPPGVPGVYRRTSFWILLLLAAIGLAWSASSIASYLTYTRSVTESARSNLTSLTGKAALSIDAILREATDGVDAVAAGLSTGSLTKDTALARLREGLEQHTRYVGTTVSYRPFGFDPQRRLYSAYYTKKDGLVKFVQLDTVYDYTKPEYDWFGPALTGGPLWTAPYYDEAARTFMVTYSAPFYAVDPSTRSRAALGVVTVDISMDEIRRIIESLDLGPTGFGALVSQKGLYLSHPNTDLVRGKKTLAQVAAEEHDPDRLLLAGKIEKGEAGIIDHLSATTGLSAWLSYAPVPSTGWSLQNTFIKDDLPWDVARIRRQLIDSTIALLIFGVSAAALLLRVHTGSLPRLWATSIVTAILLAAGIGLVWKISLSYDSQGPTRGVQISDRATLQRVMNAYERVSAERRTEPPVYVPTGVFIESASLSAVDDLSVTGYLWQKYTIGAQDNLARGFVIGNATSLTVSDPYRQREHDVEVVRWHFNCTIRQRFDHSRFPLEQEKIGFRILHQDLNHNVVLVPDLAAYPITNPTSLPGLEKGMFLPGWELTRSFFELRDRRYETNFGLERSLAKEDFPALHFNVVIRRVLVDAFISNLTSVIIVTILLFTLLMIASRDERLVGFMQAGSGRVLNICVAMFFVIAFSHIDIRRKMAAEEIFYLEYFYFVIYAAMLWISINSVLFAMGTRIRLIHYRNNLISKLTFWPCLLGLLLVVTVFAFR
ncbi:MAG: cache domain-containing protein [Acidobacteria bacterium]|nr:cache domain-containing protein [Acidobacteriota bacterium]